MPGNNLFRLDMLLIFTPGCV